MKKTLVIILALVFCLSLMAGCGGTTSSGTSGTTSGNTSGTAESITSDTSEQKQVYNFTIAHASAEDSSGHIGALAVKKELEDSGRFTCTIYPNGQLGADREAIEGVQNGDIGMTITSPAPQANFVDAIQIYDVPFACLDLDAARALNDNDEFIGLLRDAYSEKGFYLACMSDQTFRILTTRKIEVRTPEDLKGFNVRTMENANHMLIWSSIGANPTPIAYTELYTALQQGTVDGQENALELAVTQKFFEQQDYANMTNHLIHACAWPVNLEWYNSLDDEARGIFDQAIIDGKAAQLEYVDSHQQYYRDFCNENDCTVNDMTNDELMAFRDKTTPCYSSIEQKLNDAGCGDVYTTFMDIIQSF